MKAISLTRGMVAVVDDARFFELAAHRWYALSNNCGKFYAARDVVTGGKKKTILMHRVVLGMGRELDGEHRNGNSLDNQAENLRPATRSQNHANRKRLRPDKKVPFRGVSTINGVAFTAQISIGNKKKHLGSFSLAEDAARAYDMAAIKQFGEFANLNFPINN